MHVGDGTRALITGASKGIGRALASELATRGARVGLIARGHRELDQLAAQLPNDPIAVPADVTDRRELESAIQTFADEAGGIDILVANAGVAHYGPFSEMGVDKIEEMVSINLLGSVHTVHAALPSMLSAGRGRIVVVSSGAGIRAFPSAAVYGATKAANRGFAEALHHELAGTGIGVTTVYPGEVATDFHAHQLDLLPEWRKSGEAIEPEDLARQIADAIESDERSVYAPRLVRLLGINGLSPGLTDLILRRVRGETAAPRRD